MDYPSNNRTRNDEEWSAYYDAKTLVSAREIRDDPERFEKATHEAIEMTKEAQEHATAMAAIARSGSKSLG